MNHADIRIRRITDPSDPAIAAFGELQEATYADPDMLIPPAVLPQMLARQTSERLNLMLVAEAGDEVVGGTVFHYFSGPCTGFSSFLTVAPALRGRRVATRLHEARMALLDQVATRQVHCLFIDVVAPERLTAAEVEQERAVGSDPFVRRQIFHHMGFRRVDVAYFQPPDGPDEQPITTMDLLCCTRTPAAAIPSELVARTMHDYWTPWLGKRAADFHAAELRRRCSGNLVALTPAYTPEIGGLEIPESTTA